MLSQNYKYWASIEDLHRCIDCARLHGTIYKIGEMPQTDPPLHDNCRCSIRVMEALLAGTATGKGKNGADWWIATLNQLPPYYITKDEARSLGWKAWKGNLATVAPNKMLAKGVYYNDNRHLPDTEGRVWYEADINYTFGWRGNERILYSNDGLIFITRDHYRTFIEIVSPTSTLIGPQTDREGLTDEE